MTSQPAAANPRATPEMPIQLKLRLERPARVSTYRDTAIVTPNSDTPCSLLWMDLQAEADGGACARGRFEALLSRVKNALAAAISGKPSAGD